MAKFKLGDPVWLRAAPTSDAVIQGFPTSEQPAVIMTVMPWIYIDIIGYVLDITYAGKKIMATEHQLRPRRDDYQQHEALGSRDQLTKPASPSLEELIEELLDYTIVSEEVIDENAS